MDARRALEVLGLSSPTSEEGLRRAYLKAVRTHAPERDPLGFAEVRAAYELLLEGLRGTPPSQRQPKSEPAAPESVRRITQRPPPSWKVPARTSPPARPSAVPPAAAPTPDGFALRLAGADYAGATRHLLHTWTKGGELAAAPSDILLCALKLFQAHEFGLAAELLEEFEASTERAGSRPREFGTALIARWMLLSELATLPGHAEVELIVAFAAAVESGRFGPAGRVLERALAADPSLAERLKQLSPALFAATARAGEEDPEEPTPELPTAAGNA